MARKALWWRPCGHRSVLVPLAALLTAVLAGPATAHGATTIPGGPLSSDAFWTKAGSPYTLIGEVVVPVGVSLTVEPGVEVRSSADWSDQALFRLGGTLNASGTAAEPVRFRGDGSQGFVNPESSPGSSHSVWTRTEIARFRSLWPASGGSTGGSFDLTDSVIRDIAEHSYISYPQQAVHIERNVFTDSAGFSIGTSASPVEISANVFVGEARGNAYCDVAPTWVCNWAAYNGTATQVHANNFARTRGVVLSLPPGFAAAGIDGTGNYWGSLSAAEVGERILDKADDLSRASTIPVAPLLDEPADDAPPAPPPVAPILLGAPEDGYTTVTSSLFDFEGEIGARFLCSRDGGSFEDCTDPLSWSWGGLGDGERSLRVKQVDRIGAESEPTTAKWIVDTSPPAAPELASPIGGAAVGLRRPTLEWQAASDGGVGLDRYEVFIDGTKAADIAGPTAFTPTSDLAPGAHDWQVKAFDSLGNSSSSAPGRLVVDDSPPGPFGLLSPADGATVSSRPHFDWEPSVDADAGLQRYELVIDGQVFAQTAASTTELVPGADLAAGLAHDWHVIAYDALGHSRKSAARSFSVDTTPRASLDVGESPVLSGRSVEFDAGGSTAPSPVKIVRYEWDLDGDGAFERVSGTTPNIRTSYRDRGTVTPAVRVSTDHGTSDTASSALEVRPAPAAGEVGVTINDGARFTNSRDVEVSAVWPPFTTAMVLSNDGGFASARRSEIATSIPWRLQASGPERLPKTVYVRFDGVLANFTDDIILDRTPPKVIDAATVLDRGRKGRKRTFQLHIRARDRTSGVSHLQVTDSRKRPGRLREFRSRSSFRTAGTRIFVRVQDAARNLSGWKVLRVGDR